MILENIPFINLQMLDLKKICEGKYTHKNNIIKYY